MTDEHVTAGPQPGGAGEPVGQYARMVAGLPYRGDEGTAAASLRARRLARRFADVQLEDPAASTEVLRELCGHVGEDVVVVAPIFVDYGTQLSIGDRTFVNAGLVALDVVPITIGADVQIGPNVQLLAPVHPLDPELRRTGIESGDPITIEDGVWLGGGVVVTPGVTIGRDSVVGAGSVVTRDVPPRSIAVGNPARVIAGVDDRAERDAARWH
ncbi:maltose O-acetyltransferase [Pseudoclavibacter chungangensis]|nr:maltose acetyltransferase domain-containing protein [Pseudoclavibacter chungangensis]NYJ65904.1 maltose O-acetyltransferase [Pseudoclavibacter chungangensis]